jgi:transmembrane sensor
MDKKEFKLLIKKYLADEATEAEKRFVEAYYKEHDSDLSINDIMDEEEIESTELEMMDHISRRVNKKPAVQVVRRLNWRRYAAVAAMVTAIVSVSFLFYMKRNADSAYSSYYTKPGNVSKIALSDGTVVWLNADSKFRCPQSFDGSATREVYLEGEAYFEVAKDKKHPFLVHSGNLTTRVLGTKFDVNAYHTNRTIEVTLLEGKVMLTANTDIAQHKKPDTLYLKPNERAYFNKNNTIVKSNSDLKSEIKPENRDTGKKMTALAANNMLRKPLLKVQVENAAGAASWKDGRLMFDKKPLEDVIATLSRKYNVSISAKESLLNFPVTLDMGNEPVENILLAVTKQLKHHDTKGNIQSDGGGQFKKVGSKYFIE